jgi:hypothetical protein
MFCSRRAGFTDDLLLILQYLYLSMVFLLFFCLFKLIVSIDRRCGSGASGGDAPGGQQFVRL